MSTEEEIFEEKKEPTFKNWKSYFLDFFMLFLAVSLGFFADNFRENISEKTQEKEYIISMIEDAKTDKVNIQKAIVLNTERVNHLDSLAADCIKYNQASSSHADLYRHFRYGIQHPSFISPIERTMQQLKNAGGMRLIRNKTAVDMIILYNDKAKQLAGQQLYYGRYQNESIDFATQLFDFGKFRSNVAPPKSTTIQEVNTHFRLINNDKNMLIQFSNIIFVYGGVTKYYTVLLEEMDEQASDLIETLEREYGL